MVNSYLDEMKHNIESITKSMHNLGEISLSQGQNIEEVSTTIEEITLNSQRLVEGIRTN